MSILTLVKTKAEFLMITVLTRISTALLVNFHASIAALI